MIAAVFIDPPHPKGWIRTGYHPAVGHPRDAAGSLIIVWEYAAPAKRPATPEAPPRVRRGAAQGNLI